MMRYVCVIAVILAGFMAAGVTDEEKKQMHDYLVSATESCSKEFGIPSEDFEKAKRNKELQSLDPCFVACILKGNGLIDDKGMFDPAKGTSIAEKFIKSPDDIAKVKKISDICSSVNDEAVNDGDKGCDRAVLLLKCLMENKSLVV
uniref:Odorant-binding protein 18 n=1 Tax=Ectropis obliqua TaxID=248899 RepID=A0A1L2BL97_ECTOB|nr:odorant-binding protein 18 [Ectropis obliqua]